ncbi:membrane protein insertion efficiency factor YidD [Candidatus Dojkabacteria bacterium]|nr:membrane protein insertion efficiency factor YidD [Candidatus Dojkabacteria bacterium]
MKYILLFLIKIYQATLSYDHGIMGKVFPNTRYCRFTPTCSQYSYDAIHKYGSIKGTVMAVTRISKCNHRTPAGTYDPVR